MDDKVIFNYRFMLDCGLSKSYWKKWQSDLFSVARKYDNHIFYTEDINDLSSKLAAMAAGYPKGGNVGGVNWDSFVRYGGCVFVHIGDDGPVLKFTPVEGEYQNHPL